MSAASYAWSSEFGSRRHRRPLVAGGALVAMAALSRGRHRHGPPFGRGGSPFGPLFFGRPSGFRRGPRARRGDVRAAVLLLLAEGARNGYQLMQEIEQRSGGVWRPSAGSIYPALSQLEDEGLVRAEEQESRRTFALTDAGRAYVEERRTDFGVPWEEISGAVDDALADLFGEIRRVAIAAAQIGHVGNTRQVAEARRLLAEARQGLYRLLAEDEPPPPENE
jgi:DNA-binding PadR family transcriptional regulator